LLSEQIQQTLFWQAKQKSRQNCRSHEGKAGYPSGVGIVKHSTPHQIFAGVSRAMSACPPKRQPKIVVTRESVIPPFVGLGLDYSAKYEDYELGDPIGFGADEFDAVADLRDQIDES
jgi:hypothetical protein